MVQQIAGAETTVTRTEAEALLLENNLIKALQPRYNVLFRDDKSYGYILVTGHRFPQIRFYRGVQDKANRYFGPFPSSWAARETIGHLQKIFRLRTCDDTVFSHRSRPCLLAQIHRCSAPCVGRVAEEDYRRDVEHAAKFLEGREDDVIEDLNRKMQAASDRLDYELGRPLPRRDPHAPAHPLRAGGRGRPARATPTSWPRCEKEGTWCVTLAMVRGGRHLGDRSFFPQNAGGSDAATVVEAFLAQHYAVQPVPSRVIADALAGRARAGAAAGGDRRSRRDGAHPAPGRGEALAGDGAQERRDLAGGPPGRAGHPGGEGGRAHRVPRRPVAGRAHRVLRHQPHDGRGDGGLLRGLRQGRHAAVGIPALQREGRDRGRRLRRHALRAGGALPQARRGRGQGRRT